jgi:K+-sensing histidine kinase KdpD
MILPDLIFLPFCSNIPPKLLYILSNLALEEYIALGLLAVFVVIVLVLLRTLRKREKTLGEMVAAKTEELRYSMLQLEANEIELTNNLAFRERIISIVMHDLKSPLTFVHKIATALYETHAGLSKEDLERLTFELYHTSFDITNFVTNLLQWLNSAQQNFKLTYTIQPLNEFIRTSCAVYIKMANEKGLQFNFESAESLVLRADFSLLLIVLRNLLDNAIKHTREGNITVSGHANERHQFVTISDTGYGITAEKIIELENGVITKKTSESTQIGYRIVYDLVQKMKGNIHIESAEGKGSKITVQIPV